MVDETNPQEEFILDESLDTPVAEDIAEVTEDINEWGADYDTPHERNLFEIGIDAFNEFNDNYQAEDRRDLTSRLYDEVKIRQADSADPTLIQPDAAKRLYGFKTDKPMTRGRLEYMKELREEQAELDMELGKNYDRWDRHWIEGAAGLLGGFAGGFSAPEIAADFLATGGLSFAGKMLFRGGKLLSSANRLALIARTAKRLDKVEDAAQTVVNTGKLSRIGRMTRILHSPKYKELATAGGINVAIERANFALGEYHGDDRVFTAKDFAFAFLAPAAFSGLIKVGKYSIGKVYALAKRADLKARNAKGRNILDEDGKNVDSPIKADELNEEVELHNKEVEDVNGVIRAHGGDVDSKNYSRSEVRETYDNSTNQLNDLVDDLDTYASPAHALNALESMKTKLTKAGKETTKLDAAIEQTKVAAEIDKELGYNRVGEYLKNQISLMIEQGIVPRINEFYPFLKNVDDFRARLSELRSKGLLPEGSLKDLDDDALDIIFSNRAGDHVKFLSNPDNLVKDKTPIGKRQVKAPEKVAPEKSLDETISAAKRGSEGDARVKAFAKPIDDFKKHLKEYISCETGVK